MLGMSYGVHMTSTTTFRRINLVPVTLHIPAVGSPRIHVRSMHAVGNSPEGLAYAIDAARRGGFSHVEATDVDTAERYYLPV